jgi:hypothetical protein
MAAEVQVRDVTGSSVEPGSSVDSVSPTAGWTQKSVLVKTGFRLQPGIKTPRPRPTTWKQTRSPSQSSSVLQSPWHSPQGSSGEQLSTFEVCAVVGATANRARMARKSFMVMDGSTFRCAETKAKCSRQHLRGSISNFVDLLV